MRAAFVPRADICAFPLFLLVSIFANRSLPAADLKSGSLQTPESLAAETKEIFRKRCLECHGGSATQGGINILDYDPLIKMKVVVPNNPESSSAYRFIVTKDDDVRMPQNQPPLPDSNIETIRQWILAGALPFPVDVQVSSEGRIDPALKDLVGIDYVLKKILRHSSKLPAGDRVMTRYFSCNHLLTAGATRDELDLQRDALSKAMNHLSRERRIVRPTIVDPPTGTVFAIDLRDFGWHQRPYQSVSASRNEAAKFNLFDLVLLEYPYASVFEDSDTFDSLVVDYLVPAGMVRPVPFVRTDWFCSVATLPPLYHDLLQLPHDLAALEKQLNVDTDENLRQFKARRSGKAVSGVSRNNRVVERHPFDFGAYWKSFDFASSKGQENIFADPINLHAAGGEMIFNLPNGLQAYYLATGAGNRIDFGPTQIVTDKFSEDKTVRNGLGCMRCHEIGMKDAQDNVRPAVEKLPGSTGISKRDVLALYPPREEMDELLKSDSDRFMNAMEQVLGKPQSREPLIPVTQRFIDGPLTLTSAAGELGLSDSAALKEIFRSSQFAALGLIPLASQGVARRDLWEDYYDQVIRQLGLGIPVIAIDGVTRRDHQPVGTNLDIVLSTSKKNNVFAPGDELVVFVKNRSKVPVYLELFGTGTQGEIVILVPSSTRLGSGEQLRFPERGSLKVKGSLGRELISVMASESEFPAGTILRSPQMEDRLVHSFYQVSHDGRKTTLQFDAARIVKKTIEIETR